MLDKIDLLILDVDGVLTDGRIIYDSRGVDVKEFDVMDGQAVRYWLRAGHKAAILSGRASRTIRIRAKDIGIDAVYENAKDKLPVFEKALKRFGRTADRVCCIGDDLPDLPLLAQAGFAVATAGASAEVKRVAHYVTCHRGGAGAVREVIELVLKYQGRWDEILDRYTSQLPAGLPASRRPRRGDE
jgi:3-deoxy-D-manno-octulosonate 8-phosphate phosphatase (KDO 8-P phosphatase)